MLDAEIRIGYARVSTKQQEIQSQIDALTAANINRLFQEHVSTRVRERPEMKAALAAAWEYRATGAKVTLVVHEMKRLGRGALDLLKAAGSVGDEEQRFSGSSGGAARVERGWLRTAARCRRAGRRVPLGRGPG
ncbi:recombinase family protein [Streptomyces sp. NPDC001750]|uniref:recombinase family protein n=1 Tax=Streptomyces sp. NPDC001750 TaxID=3364607 RepID=UPI0036BEA167